MKKIISLLVITTIVFSMVASLNITTASAASTNLYNFSVFDSDSKLIDSNDAKKFFQISSNDKTKNVTYFPDGVDNVTTEPVLNIISDKYIWNNKAQIDLVNHPVVNINFQYYIPKGTEKDGRVLSLQLGKKGTDYNNSNYGIYNFYFNSSNNYVAGTVSGNAKVVTKYNYSIVPTDQWHNANLKIIAETDSSETKSIKVCMYVDGRKHIICQTTNTDIKFDDVGIQQLYFNTTNGAKHTKNTYIKNIKVDYEDTDPTIYNTVLFDTDLGDTKFSTNSTTKALEAKAVGKSTTILQTSSASDNHFETEGTTPYQNVTYTGDNGALKVTLTPNDKASARHALIQNFKSNLIDYFPKDTTKYIEISYDIMNPEGSQSALKEQEWRFGNNTSSLNASIYTISSRLVGNKITIFNENTYDGDETTKKSVEFTAESGKWYRIIKLLTVENTGSAYNIHADGYVKDLATDKIYKIYESDEVVPGGTGFVLAQQRTDIVTEAGDTDVVTYYDNFLSRIWEDDFSNKYNNVINSADEDSNYEIELNCFDGTNAVAKARQNDGIGSKKLILAAYDGNKLVDIIVSTGENITDPDKGIVELNMNIDGKNVKKLKAFFFDAITTCKPLATAPELEVK